jgi:hypothetical protein
VASYLRRVATWLFGCFCLGDETRQLGAASHQKRMNHGEVHYSRYLVDLFCGPPRMAPDVRLLKSNTTVHRVADQNGFRVAGRLVPHIATTSVSNLERGRTDQRQIRKKKKGEERKQEARAQK